MRYRVWLLSLRVVARIAWLILAMVIVFGVFAAALRAAAFSRPTIRH